MEGREAVIRTLAHLPEGPWITISTQLGAGGPELAQRLGARLGWQVFDKEIVGEIAKHTNTKEKVLSRLDDHAVGAFEDYVASLFSPGSPGRSAYALELIRVVWAIARQGQAIMLGRGANWLLDPRYGLHVRAIAPVEARAAWRRTTSTARSSRDRSKRHGVSDGHPSVRRSSRPGVYELRVDQRRADVRIHGWKRRRGSQHGQRVDDVLPDDGHVHLRRLVGKPGASSSTTVVSGSCP